MSLAMKRNLPSIFHYIPWYFYSPSLYSLLFYPILYISHPPLVPDLVLSVNITDTSDPSSLNCCASKLVKGLSNTPVITWYDPNGKVVNTTGSLEVPALQESEERQICLMLFVDDKNKYTCVVELDSPALSRPLVESVTFSEGTYNF